MGQTPCEWVLVRADALPDVYRKVLEIQTALSAGRYRSVSEAVRANGISRSAFYKYKDTVAPYPSKRTQAASFTVDLVLQDRPGVLSALLSAFAHIGANIVTVNQQSPEDGSAHVSICAVSDGETLSETAFAEELAKISGVQRVKAIRKAEK